jgi:DNA modification methylase
MTYYTDPLVTLLHGDCLEVLPALEADSVDAVVTDPPYGLEFMGKEWDSFRSRDTKEVTGFDPKGQRLDGEKDKWGAWGNRPRSFAPNKMPKCAKCGKWQYNGWKPRQCSCDEPEWVLDTWSYPQKFQQWCEQWGREALRVTKPGGYLLAFGGTRTHHRLVCALEDAGWIIRDELGWIYASGFPKGKANLKPAHEPIVLARKPGPLRPLGIDECRIPSSADDAAAQLRANTPGAGRYAVTDSQVYGGGEGLPSAMRDHDPSAGRWPSNVLLSDSELFDQPNPYVVGSGAVTTSGERAPSEDRGDTQSWRMLTRGNGADSGGYSRFFIIPKADRAERERGLADRPQVLSGSMAGGEETRPDRPSNHPLRANVHPTVKPIDLMRHLVRLVTPPGGVVLDPFLGSGTTCLAASEEGFRSIGIERELEYLEIAKGRLMATPMGLGLDHGLAGKASPKTHPDLSKHQPKRRAPGENYSGGWAGTDEEPAA